MVSPESGESIPGRFRNIGGSAVSALIRLSKLEMYFGTSRYVETLIHDDDLEKRRQDAIAGRLIGNEILRRLETGDTLEYVDGQGKTESLTDMLRGIDGSISYAEMGFSDDQAEVLEAKRIQEV